jgi:hypothetical protein
VRLSDTGSGRQWSDALLRNGNYTGVAQLPHYLIPAAVLEPNATIQLELEDLSGVPNTVQLAIAGYKVFRE